MRNFEFTDRGKIFITVIIAVLILIISIVLAVLTLSANSSDPDPPVTDNDERSQIPSEAPPEPTNNGGDESQPEEDEDDPIDDQTEDIELDPLIDGNDDDFDEPDDDLDIVLIAPENPVVNLSAGTFKFFFSVDLQSTLDRNSLILLDTFLASPKNRPETVIAVETPRLDSSDNNLVMSAITSALGERNIGTERIMQLVDPQIPLSDFFEVNLYYIDRPETK